MASDDPRINWTAFVRTRAELGTSFVRIVGYFRDDGARSVAQIEQAMRAHSAAAMVIPAHTLKGEARQFGADALGDLSEEIEALARLCVERHDTPSGALEKVVRLRPLFEATLHLLERERGPVMERRPALFGRRSVAS